MNDGFRLVLETRGRLWFWSFTSNGRLYESSRGHLNASEALQESELHQRLLRQAKWREQNKARAAANQQ
jgi:hypothetical protein